MTYDFWNKFSTNTKAIESAMKGEDWTRLSEIVDELSECLQAVEPKLNLSVSGPKPYRLSILSLPGADEVADRFVATSNAPKKWDVRASLPEFDPNEEMSAEDEHGESLNVKYEELDGKVLPPVDGKVTIVFSLDAEFDPAGSRGHLYKAIAENVVFTVLGGWPPELEKAMLLPRSVTGQQFPLEQLRQQWINVCGLE